MAGIDWRSGSRTSTAGSVAKSAISPKRIGNTVSGLSIFGNAATELTTDLKKTVTTVYEKIKELNIKLGWLPLLLGSVLLILGKKKRSKIMLIGGFLVLVITLITKFKK